MSNKSNSNTESGILDFDGLPEKTTESSELNITSKHTYDASGSITIEKKTPFDSLNYGFQQKEKLLSDLGLPTIDTDPKNIDFKNDSPFQRSFSEDTIILKAYKEIDNIPARIIDIGEEFVVLDCVLDEEKGIFKEKIFKKSVFSASNLVIGRIILLRSLEKENEIKMEIHYNKELEILLKKKFPEYDFVKEFEHLPLTKKKKS